MNPLLRRSPGWPATLSDGSISIRPLRLRDAQQWSTVRMANEQWLRTWEATPGLSSPEWRSTSSPAVFRAMRRRLHQEAAQGRCVPFAVAWEDTLVGQLTIGNIVRGAFQSGYAGYWVDKAYAGRGIMPTALALAVDHCFSAVKLHRIEVNIRPENGPSRRVVEKLGFREEAMHQRYLAIDGAFRDHIGYALTVEDVPQGLLRRWKSTDSPG
jgi:ribosomal-protein-alanine N-acetyltransferase